MSKETFDRNLAAAAQREYQNDNAFPHFAPSSGVCYRCKMNIYNEMETSSGGKTYKSGISVEKAGSELITGCPHCNHSYVE